MTRIAIYHGRGSQVRTNNYAEQTALFVAKQYPQKNWYEGIFTIQLLIKGICIQRIQIFLEKLHYGLVSLKKIIV